MLQIIHFTLIWSWHLFFFCNWLNSEDFLCLNIMMSCRWMMHEWAEAPAGEWMSEGKKRRDRNRENDEQENWSLNPPANPPRKTSEKCKASRAHLKTWQTFQLLFVILPSSLHPWSHSPCLLVNFLKPPPLSWHPPFHSCSPCSPFHPHPCYSILHLLPPSLGCYISLPVTMTDLMMVVVGAAYVTVCSALLHLTIPLPVLLALHCLRFIPLHHFVWPNITSLVFSPHFTKKKKTSYSCETKTHRDFLFLFLNTLYLCRHSFPFQITTTDMEVSQTTEWITRVRFRWN